MGEKLKPKRDPAENEARQAARAEKRARLRDAYAIAQLVGLLRITHAIRDIPILDADLVFRAARILDAAKNEATK